jgi:hypothetical protein
MLCRVKALFVELPAFERHRSEYLDDEAFSALQAALMADPEAGDEIRDPGGLRKVRFADSRRGKGKRGGLRVIYYWWALGPQFWLFTLYGRGEVSDLTAEQRKVVREGLKAEWKARKSP